MNPSTRSTSITVERVQAFATHTIITGAGGASLRLRPFLYVSPGEILEYRSSSPEQGRVWKRLADPATGRSCRILICPPYMKTQTLFLPPWRFRLTFRERLSRSDWKAAKYLETFHYRGKGLNRLVGRRAVLLVEAEAHGVVGYGVLASTVGAARPRFKLFKTDFTDQMRSRLINKLVRIPRIVVHPEFRGMGIGALMARHLVNYARTRWDVRGYRPILVEVIAAMTEYHKFFEKSGFLPLGYTEGINRVVKPLYGRSSFQDRRNAHNYDFYQDSRPKPYLVYPLVPNLRRRLRPAVAARHKSTSLNRPPVMLRRSIRLNRVSVTYRSKNGVTNRSREVRNAFDVDASQLSSEIIRDLSLIVRPGSVTMFTGASGSGKSTILKLLTQQRARLRRIMTWRGRLERHQLSRVGVLRTTNVSRRALVDQLGKSTREAISLLNGVGLAEAHLYIKAPEQLSEGQKYRFAIAKLCASGKAVWVADEFASSLDPYTAAIVAKGLRRMAWKRGATVVLAAPHVDHFAGSLVPNTIVLLSWGGKPQILGLRMTTRRVEGGYFVHIRNTGEKTLRRVVIAGVRLSGPTRTLKVIAQLPPHNLIRSRMLGDREINSLEALMVTSGEGVGDILYLRK